MCTSVCCIALLLVLMIALANVVRSDVYLMAKLEHVVYNEWVDVDEPNEWDVSSMVDELIHESMDTRVEYAHYTLEVCNA